MIRHRKFSHYIQPFLHPHKCPADERAKHVVSEFIALSLAVVMGLFFSLQLKKIQEINLQESEVYKRRLLHH